MAVDTSTHPLILALLGQSEQVQVIDIGVRLPQVAMEQSWQLVIIMRGTSTHPLILVLLGQSEQVQVLDFGIRSPQVAMEQNLQP